MLTEKDVIELIKRYSYPKGPTGSKPHSPVTVADSDTIDFSITGQQVSGGIKIAGIIYDYIQLTPQATDPAAITGKTILYELTTGEMRIRRSDGTITKVGESYTDISGGL